MVTTALLVVLVIAVGGRAADNLRVRQQEVILQKLPEAERMAYYEVLRRRVRKLIALRAIAMTAVFVLAYSYKYHLAGRNAALVPAPVSSQSAPR